MAKKFFIGIAWPYVNGELHIGHLAGYLVPADIFARFQRFLGNDVLMVSGSDCHGTPITVEAEKKNLSPEKIVQLYHPKHKKLFQLYQISFDLYTKTTTKNHREIVQQFFLNLLRNGYLFKGKTLQYFSPEEKKFLPDRYVEGTCPNCSFTSARGDQCDECGFTIEEGKLINPKSKLTGKKVILKETEHYFLNLPKFQKFLESYVAQKGPSWRKWVYQETLGWLKRGLEPRSITRDLTWGIKLPIKQIPNELRIDNIQNKRIYVWFEAVIGYFSASVELARKKTGDKNSHFSKLDLMKDFWYNKEAQHYYFMGKDNLVFHTIIWPAELYGADPKLHLPDFPIINNFLTLEGSQFSKSRGIVVDAKYFAETYGVDTARFYFALISPEEKDFDFTWQHFVETNNGVIVGVLGNFIYRTLNLTKSVKKLSIQNLEAGIFKKVEKFLVKVNRDLSQVKLRDYTSSLIDLAKFGNQYLEKKAPWRLEKESQKYQKIISNAVYLVLALHLALEPLVPKTNQRLGKMLNIKISRWPKNPHQFLKKLLPKIKIGKIEPLFPKIDPSIITKENSKLNI